MADLNPCPSCRDPLDHPSGDGCANMTAHKERAMSDQELIESLRLWNRDDAADRIEALTSELDRWKDACRSASRDLNIVVPDNDRLKSERDAAEAKLANAVATERARIVKLLDGIDRTELDDNGWWETSFGAKFGEGILNAILKGYSHE